ncbi:MAG: hypothetical protein U0Q14_11965 [Dermatophilaceae bacterium]
MKPDALSPWYRDLVVALRVRGASGREIGDAVAAVQSHCADSGDTPEEAFGAAQQYADALPLAAPAPSGLTLLVNTWPSWLGLLGLFLALACYDAWHTNTPVSVSVGTVVLLVVIVALAVGIVRFMGPVWRHRVLTWAVLSLAFALGLLAQVTLRQSAFSLPLAVAAPLAAVLLFGPALYEQRHLATAYDPVEGPFETRAGSERAGRRAAQFLAWLLPVGTVVVIAIAATLDHLSRH